MGENVIKLYQHGCPNCLRLKNKLDSKKIAYENITDKNLMISLGFKSAPKLEVNGEIMDFKQAMKWVEEQ
jgi:glutaredoxin